MYVLFETLFGNVISTTFVSLINPVSLIVFFKLAFFLLSKLSLNLLEKGGANSAGVNKKQKRVCTFSAFVFFNPVITPANLAILLSALFIVIFFFVFVPSVFVPVLTGSDAAGAAAGGGAGAT
jgi:hypothetical protein